MANGRQSDFHVSPSITSIVAVLAVALSVLTYIMQPTNKDIERLNARMDRNDVTIGQVGPLTAGLDTLRATIAGNDRVFVNLHGDLERRMSIVEAQQRNDAERAARLDESVRILDSSMPPLSSRLSTLEAKMEATMRTLDLTNTQKAH